MTIKVRVRNFQSIEDASVVISGLTVITGTNNAGKSALFRAIRGAFTNTQGHAFVRSGQAHCTVDLEFEDGRTLTWEKGKSVNTYVVNGKTYRKVDRGVPPEVRIFGVDPIQAGDKELWPQIAPQITGVMFLLNETGSVLAEAVADVARVNQLTAALKACDSDRRTVRSDIKARTETTLVLDKQRATFTGLDEVVAKLAELDKQRLAGERLTKAIMNLEKMGTKYRGAFDVVASLQGIDGVAQALPDDKRVTEIVQLAAEIKLLRGLYGRLRVARETTNSLDGLDLVKTSLPSDLRIAHIEKFRHGIGITVGLILRYDKAQGELTRANEAQVALSGVALDDSLVERIQKFVKAMQAVRQFQGRWAQLRRDVAALGVELASCEARKKSVDAEVIRLLGSSKGCPTCGGDLGHIRHDEPLV